MLYDLASCVDMMDKRFRSARHIDRAEHALIVDKAMMVAVGYIVPDNPPVIGNRVGLGEQGRGLGRHIDRAELALPQAAGTPRGPAAATYTPGVISPPV